MVCLLLTIELARNDGPLNVGNMSSEARQDEDLWEQLPQGNASGEAVHSELPESHDNPRKHAPDSSDAVEKTELHFYSKPYKCGYQEAGVMPCHKTVQIDLHITDRLKVVLLFQTTMNDIFRSFAAENDYYLFDPVGKRIFWAEDQRTIGELEIENHAVFFFIPFIKVRWHQEAVARQKRCEW